MRCISSTRRLLLGLAAATLLASSSGCSDLFSPTFLQLFGSSSTTGFQALDPPLGHTPIVFKNNARMSEEVFTFMLQGDPGLSQTTVDEVARVNPQLTPAVVEAILQGVLDGTTAGDLEVLNLPPRVRMTIVVTKVNGGQQRLIYLNGLRLLRGETAVGGGGASISTNLPPDLVQNSNSTFVVQCSIATLTVESIEVYVPVVIRLLELVFINVGTTVTTQTFCNSFVAPQFNDLQADEGLDATQGSFSVLRNYDPRFFPPPIGNLQCGGVVTYELRGDLALPFNNVPNECLPEINPPANGEVPGYFQDNEFEFINSLQIPGRYSLEVRVRGG